VKLHYIGQLRRVQSPRRKGPGSTLASVDCYPPARVKPPAICGLFPLPQNQCCRKNGLIAPLFLLHRSLQRWPVETRTASKEAAHSTISVPTDSNQLTPDRGSSLCLPAHLMHTCLPALLVVCSATRRRLQRANLAIKTSSRITRSESR